MMKRAMYGAGIIGKDGNDIGISLGWSPCSEHEWGIDGLRHDFGIGDSTGYGYSSRKITRLPSNLQFGKRGSGVYAIYGQSINPDEILARAYNMTEQNLRQMLIGRALEGKLEITDSSGLATAWDRSSFGIHGRAEQFFNLLNYFEEAFLNYDVVISGPEGQLINRLGLLIYSRIPEDVRKKAEEMHKKALEKSKKASSDE